MRFFPILLSLFALLAGAMFLPGLWTGKRDLGILSVQSLEANGAEKLGALSSADRDTLIKREMEVLRSQPLDTDAHRNLALLSLLPPASESSRALILNLSRHSLRNPAIQMAAMGVLLEAKNLPETLYRIDAILRAQPVLAKQIYPLIAQNFSGKPGVALLVKSLASDPPWRSGLLNFLAEQPAYEALSLDIIRSLKSTASPVKTAELKSIFTSWINNSKTYGRSYFVWLDQLSADELRLVKAVYDGEFSSEPKGLFFDWTISSNRNGRASISLKPGSSTDRALLVDFVGNKDPFQQVYQYLQLASGRYVLSFEAMSKSLVAEKGLVWRLSCVGAPGYLAETTAVQTAMPWTRFSAAFEVPEANCETQILRLETKALSGLDTAVTGQVYFDSLAVTPAATQPPAE